MATVKGGTKICDNPECEQECTHLYGMVVMVRRDMLDNQRVKEAYTEIEKEFGQRDFVFCYRCTAVAFGAKTLAQKRAMVARAAIGKSKNGDKDAEKEEKGAQG